MYDSRHPLDAAHQTAERRMTMARYMKVEDVFGAVTELRCFDCTDDNPIGCPLCQLAEIRRKLCSQPVFLDVAPRSEVAREIFGEIEAEIVAALESNYSARTTRMKKVYG